MIGDCDYCGHSAMYHVPFVGCMKCGCDEFTIRRAVASVFALVVSLAALAGCTCEDASREALRKHGFTDIQMTGWSPLTCSDEDTFSTGFRAKNAQGQIVEGTVCCGLLKSCTVRF